jgi:glucose/arabinose dehydrogenase
MHRQTPMNLPLRSAALPTAALLWVLACTPVVAQPSVREEASTTAHRDRPAQAAYSDSIVNRLRVPPGFAVNVYASGLENPRMMEVAPDGSVLVTRRRIGDVLVLRDADGDGRADTRDTFVRGLPGVHGIALRDGAVTLATSTAIVRTPWPGPGALQTLASGLPDGGQHGNRMVRFAPDGDMLVSVGSSCNDCAEENQLERATMMRYSPQGERRRIEAIGLRNTIGYDWHPLTGELWGMDNGNDLHGDDVPPEELNRIVNGRHYGWPVCYGQQVVDLMTNAAPDQLTLEPGQRLPKPQGLSREQFCALTVPSVLTAQAHSAPIAMRFYTGTQFPTAWRNDAFVAFRGSWGRSEPVGYKVVRVRYSPAGQPLGFEDFLTGFLSEDGGTHHGRPSGIAIAADGALLVSDDTLGVIYRVSWVGGAARAGR